MAAMGQWGRKGVPWRAIAWGGAAGVLALPFVAMRFTSEVNWSPADFVFAGILIGGTGLLFELSVRFTSSRAYRAGVAAALAAAFLTVWINGAVGMIGSEDNPYNLLFLAIIPFAAIGAALARLRPGGMALTMALAAGAHGAVALIGWPADPRGAVFSLPFATIWLFAALFFRAAALDDEGKITGQA